MNINGAAGRTAVRTDSPQFTEILENIELIGEQLRRSTADSEREGRLTDDVLQALRNSGAMHMRVPREAGGPDLDVVEQIAILARLAEFDSASAWCTMVANNGIGGLAAFLPDEGVAEIFADGPRPVGASVNAPGGFAKVVSGGYSLSGTWKFCSNLFSADWVRCNARIDGDPGRLVMVAIPKSDLTILDTWHVTGLKGTGSADFSVDDIFIPAHRSVELSELTQLRGSRDYTRDVGGAFAIYEHAAFALGVGRRALGLIRTNLNDRAARGVSPVVEAELSRLFIELSAADHLVREAFSTLDAGDDDGSVVLGQSGLPALATYATEVAHRCASFASRRAGSQALYVPNPFETALRDVNAALAHVLVSDRNYVSHGSALVAGAGEFTGRS